MAYDVDYDFEFDEDEFGTAMMPKGVKWRGNLCLLPNGKYLPPGNYRTEDGGATWAQVLRNRDERGFFDCMAFEGERGWLLGDPVDGFAP